RAKAARDAAKLYDKLARLPGDPAAAERYLFEAVALDPSKARTGKIAGRIRKLAGNRKSADAAGWLLVRLREADREGAGGGRYDALEAELAQKDAVLIKGPGHDMVGYLSLPRSWRRKAQWPVLVAVDGAGSNFLGAARRFAQARGSRNFIVLVPCSLSNTNALQPQKYPWYRKEVLEGGVPRIRFDLDGLAALLDAVRERFGGGAKIGITGFSGGGNLCYAMTALHPDRILFAAPACANFSGMGFSEAGRVEGGGPPVHILTGEKDPHRRHTRGNPDIPGIEPQTDAAVQALEERGFTRVRRTMLPGVKHSACPRQVWEFCDEVRRGS
ncbi:MAG: alpha/beta hydrolase, partial [Planctomycetota bacterium]